MSDAKPLGFEEEAYLRQMSRLSRWHVRAGAVERIGATLDAARAERDVEKARADRAEARLAGFAEPFSQSDLTELLKRDLAAEKARADAAEGKLASQRRDLDDAIGAINACARETGDTQCLDVAASVAFVVRSLAEANRKLEEVHAALREAAADPLDKDDEPMSTLGLVAALELDCDSEHERAVAAETRERELRRDLATLREALAKASEPEAPYCDVCGNRGANLHTSVEVCRDCYDVARGESVPGESGNSLDTRVRAIIDPARQSDGGEGTMVTFGYETLYSRVRDSLSTITESGERGKLSPKLRELLGKKVRRIWIDWANEQADPKPSWLVPWERLSDRYRDVDIRIGVELYLSGRDSAGVLSALRAPEESGDLPETRSRSVLRREAAQRGEPAPQFNAPKWHPALHPGPLGSLGIQCLDPACPNPAHRVQPPTNWRNLLVSLMRANEAYFVYWSAEHEVEDCPRDDTCECEMVCALNEAHRAATEALARHR